VAKKNLASIKDSHLKQLRSRNLTRLFPKIKNTKGINPLAPIEAFFYLVFFDEIKKDTSE
jgi:hypothetical protein